PVIDFDKCIKCTLCWLQCPDSCFDVMPDGTYDLNAEACCGCGVCEAVCPVDDCETMVNEAYFGDNKSQWEMFKMDKACSKAVAVATKLADVDVLTAYPIRPYDTLMQYVAKQIANGEQDAEYIVAESEHSQLEIAKHAEAVGARAMCGSSGVGWCYAFEAIAVTPALRLPLVAMVGNRALDDPGAFGTEHNDALAARDLGWMHVWVDTAQEALDTTLMA